MNIIGRTLRFLILEGSAIVLMVVLFVFLFVPDWWRAYEISDNNILFGFAVGNLVYILLQSIAAVYRTEQKAMKAKSAIFDLLVSSLPLFPLAVAGTLYLMAHPPLDMQPLSGSTFVLNMLQGQVLIMTMIAVWHDLLVNTLVPIKYKECFEKGQDDQIQKSHFVTGAAVNQPLPTPPLPGQV